MELFENELPKCYKILFDAVEKAIEAIDQQNCGIAKTLLIRGQIKAESAFVEDSLQQDGLEEPPAEEPQAAAGIVEAAADSREAELPAVGELWV